MTGHTPGDGRPSSAEGATDDGTREERGGRAAEDATDRDGAEGHAFRARTEGTYSGISEIEASEPYLDGSDAD